MIQVGAETAASQGWGAVVVGTSFASMFFAHGLRGVSPILFVEKGEMTPHAEQLRLGQTNRKRTDFRQDPATPRRDAKLGKPKLWAAHTMFGGNSNCWWACTPRFHPDDFRLASLHGVGVDWPIGYSDLEPWYAEVEDIMDVAGGGSDHLLPRSRPFPSPPHRASRSDLRLQAHSRNWFIQATARSNGTRRARCCANGVCQLCPIDSKFTILNSLAMFDRPDFHLLLEADARQLRIEAGMARSLMVRTVDRKEHEIRGEIFALGANAIGNPSILLRSGVSNPNLGRYLHEQLGQDVMVDIDSENYFGGTSITGQGYDLYAGAHRATAAAVLIENINSPTLVRPEPKKWTHRLYIHLIAEDLPSVDSRVTLDADEPLIRWTGFSDYAYAGMARAQELLPSVMPFAIEGIEYAGFGDTEWHILGTTRIGTTAADGVVDDRLRCFDVSNVLCLGSGAFPTGSAANPTLTLSTLSLRAGRSLS